MHLRLIVPADLTDRVETLLLANGEVSNLAIMQGVARRPDGDLVTLDVTREATSALIADLKRAGVDKAGAISVDHVAATIDQAGAKEDRGVGGASDAIVWEEVEAKTQDEVDLSLTFLTFMGVAIMIAGLGVLLDQPILIVGAMVVGPDFGPLAALAVGIVRGRWRVARRAIGTLASGFAFGVLVTIVLTLALTAVGLIGPDLLERERPLTDFIWSPDALSWVIGFLAGLAGMLSLTSTKSGALVGVLISVTTVPAAGNAGVAIAYGVWDQAGGSAIQLGVNLVAITVGAVLTLLVQRANQRRVDRRDAPIEHEAPGSREPGAS